MSDSVSEPRPSVAPPSAQVLSSGYQRLIKARYGFVLYNSNDFVVGRLLEMYGEYFESEVEIFRQIVRPGDVVLDVGANIGAHTLALANLVGSQGWVMAFEPQRLVHQTLCANAALNCLDNVQCVAAALGEDLIGLLRSMGHRQAALMYSTLSPTPGGE